MSCELSEESIDALSDLLSAYQLMQRVSVDHRGVTSLEDAKCRLLRHVRTLNGGGRKVHSNAADLLKEVLETDRHNRQELETLYTSAVQFLAELPKERREELNVSVPDYDESTRNNLASVQKNDCAILVAGEVSAGKSSLLNLLLGTDLLPTSLLSCTSVITELKHKDDKYAIAHHWDSTRPGSWLDLAGENPSEVLAKYVHQKEDRERHRFPYKRVEVFWPFPLLQGGIFIVDSPGIGESREMSELVKGYLSSACAFIYVINSSNAGGLQPDRLQDLLVELSRREDALSTFDPRSAVFVLNKWDQVPTNEASVVFEDTLLKLQKCWPGVEKSQVFTMSSLKAHKSINEFDFVTSDFAKLLEGIEELLPISLRCKLEKHYRWLSMLLRRSSFYLRVYIANETRTDEERKELTEYLHRQLDKLDTDNRRVATELKLELHRKTSSICDQLIAHLASASTRCRLMTWEDPECPDGEDWDMLQEVLVSKVNKKIRREVNEWDSKNNIFRDLQLELVQKFRDEFELMEEQLAIVEGDMTGSGTRAMDAMTMMRQRVHTEQQPWLTMGQKIALGIAAPLLIPLGVVAGMFVLPVAGVRAIQSKLADMQSLNEYRQCKVETMALMTDQILESFLERTNLNKLIASQLQLVTQNVDAMIKSIPNIIEADRIMINKLQEEREATEMTMAQQYLPLQQKCQALLGKLDYFYVSKVRTFAIPISSLTWNRDSPPLASGRNADIYVARWQTEEGEERNVCVKLRTLPVDKRNVTEILQEEDNIRRLRHENIVSFYGTCALRSHNGLQCALVLGACEETLGARISGPHPPGKLGAAHPFWPRGCKMVMGSLRQLASVLLYLHNRGLVHGDLAPNTVLLDKDDNIKLAGVAQSKLEQEVSAVRGSSCYVAPEVLEGLAFCEAADVFSLAIIAWELWYGRYVKDEIAKTHRGSEEKAIREGIRPSLKLSHDPPEQLKELVSTMWSHDPKARPHMSSVLDCITDMTS